MNRLILASVLGAFILGGCGSEETATSATETAAQEKAAAPRELGPAETIDAAVAALRTNDLAAVLTATLPADELERIRAEYDEERKSAVITDEERAEFAAQMNKLTADDAEEALMAELRPQLVELGPQLPMIIGFGQMMVNEGIQANEELDPARKQEVLSASTAVFSKLQGMNLADQERASQAVNVVVRTARDLDLATLDDVHALEFEQFLAKGNTVLGGVKDVLRVYEIDVDAVLASVKTEVVSKTDDNATLNVSYDLFGLPQTAEVNLARKDQRWVSADLIEQLENQRNAVTVEDDMLSSDSMEGEAEAVPAEDEHQ